MHFNLVPRVAGQTTDTRTEALRDRVLSLAIEDFGASFSGEHGIGRANQAAYDRYVPTPVQCYSGAIAQVFARLTAAAVRFGPPSVGEKK